MSGMSVSHEIRTDVAGLIRLLAKNLYAQPDVFIREMIQNAHDAIQRRREVDGEGAPGGLIQLRVNWSHDSPTITFEDNGAGLSEQEVHEYLSTIGRSGTDQFRRQLMEKGRYAEANSLIGQFGIGLLSAFVVAERVVVQTRSCRANNPGWRWECWGDKAYTLTPDESLSVGSRVILYIDANHRDVLDLEFVRKAVRKYADFISVPIHLNQEGRINSVDAPWHRSYASEDERLAEHRIFVNRRFPDIALSVIPVNIAQPFPVQGVLYISNQTRSDLSVPGRVDIYQSRMFITADHPDLLPPWAKFVRGVVDSTALTPTAARDNIQQDQAFRGVRDGLGRVIIEHLKQMARENLSRFQEIMDWHHYHIKGMALKADDFFREVADLLPFETNKGPMSLKDYLQKTIKSLDGRRTILYFSERGQATQFFMLADAKGILVINASYVHESKFLRKYAEEKPDIKLEQLDFAESSIIFEKLSPSEAQPFQELMTEFSYNMPTGGSRAKIVRFTPVHIPAVLTLTEGQKLRSEMSALKDNPIIPTGIRELLGRVMEDKPTIPVTIHLNADNPTIQALVKMNLRSEIAVNSMIAIYNNALMLAQHLITPRNAEVMFGQFNKVINMLIEQTQQSSQLRQQATQLETQLRTLQEAQAEQQAAQQEATPGDSRHVTCFVAFDYDQKKHVFEALRDILQDRPYFWEVVRADARIENSALLPNLTRQINKADCFIVELSDRNPSVLLELGMILTKERPYLLLWNKTQQMERTEGWTNLIGILRTEYQPLATGDPLRETLQQAIQKQGPFQTLAQQKRPKYLSPIIWRGAKMGTELPLAVSKTYQTVEEFVHADPDAVANRVGASPFFIRGLQEYARTYCNL